MAKVNFTKLGLSHKNDEVVTIQYSGLDIEIKQYLGVEEKADLIYKNIQELHLENPAFIGISSRSIRMLSAERLIKEAKEALNHAIEAKDESPIIGFHVDVEKYREYIKNN